MPEFKKEQRYIVVKLSDLEHAKEKVTAKQFETFQRVLEMVTASREIGLKKPPLCCVVVEGDWSIYEQVWNLVQQEFEAKK